MKRTLAVLAASLASAATAQHLPSGYTCCNLHHDNFRISDANWTHAPMIPAGVPIRVIAYGWNTADVEIDGKPFMIAHEYGRKQESVEAFVAKLVAKESPRGKIEAWPEPIRTAVHRGTVVNGMTREQALVSLGYPPTHRTPSLDANLWHHWQSRAGRFEIYWGQDGKIERTNGVKDR